MIKLIIGVVIGVVGYHLYLNPEAVTTLKNKVTEIQSSVLSK